MKLGYIGSVATLLLKVTVLAAAMPFSTAYAAGEPQMVSTAGYEPPSPEAKLYMEAGRAANGTSRSSRPSKVDYTPPVDIFGKTPYGPFSHFAFGLTATTIGGGVQIATPLGNRLNLRVGGNFVQFQYPFTKDGVDYTPRIKLESGQGTVDWFPGNGEFHVSAGALYFRNGFSGLANVQPGQIYKLGDTTYINSIDDPVSGNASLSYDRKVAPIVLLGWGNLIPRTGRHVTFPVEFGVAYMGAPQMKLQLSGTSCTTDGCFDNATDPSTLNNIKQEQNEIDNDLRYTKFYPVLSMGFGYRF